MPKLAWSAFLDRHPAAHLVAAVMPESEPVKAHARLQLGLLAKLIAGLSPKGSYALTVDRQGRTPEIHCVFEKETDALKVASTVGATATDRCPGWASQRTFLLDAYASRAITAAPLRAPWAVRPRAVG